MRQSLKIALSLLISLVLFGGFALLAFSGLFVSIEAEFFQPRVREARARELTELAGAVSDYHDTRIALFGALLRKPAVWNAFLTPQSDEDIRTRADDYGRLLEQNPDVQLVRFLSDDGRTIHYSTSPGDEDLSRRTGDQREYRKYEQVDSSIPAAEIAASADGEPRVLIDGVNDRFVYSFPISDDRGTFHGTALFYVLGNDLESFLLNLKSLSIRDITIIDRVGVVTNLVVGETERAEMVAAISEAWQGLEAGPPEVAPFPYVGEGGEPRLLVGLLTDRFGAVGTLIPSSEYILDARLKAFLLAIVFATFFLAAFLILNIRQDPMVVVARRVRRFQVEFVQEFVDSGEELKSERWSAELERRKTDLTTQVRRGVGRVSEEKQHEIDDLINRSWEEVLAILSARAPRARSADESVDLKRIEEIIQRALSGGRVVVQAVTADAVAGAVGVQTRGAAPKPIEVETVETVEEVGEAEAVEEVGEAEAVEEVGEAEAVEEAAEPEAVEEVGEAEAVEEVGEAEAVEEVGEAEAVEEVGEAEAVEEAAEPEAVEELEEAVSVEELPPEPEEDLELLSFVEEEPFGTMETEIGAEEELEEAELEEIGEFEGAGTTEAAAMQPEEPEEPEEAPPAAAPAADQAALDQLHDLIRSGRIILYEEPELVSALEARRSSVVLENGVYRIREDLFRPGSGAGPSQEVGEEGAGDLRQLAESVMAPENAPDGVEGEPEGVSGIGDILGGVDGIDLLDQAEIEEIRAGARGADRGERKAKRLGFAGGALDLDGYLAQFADPDFEPTQFRALVEVSRRIQAVAAAVLTEVGGAFRALFSIGLSESGSGRFAFPAGEAVGGEILQQRRAAVVNEGLDGIAAFAEKATPDDLRFMRRVALVPAVFRGQKGYLFLAFAEERDWSLDSLLDGLDIG